MVVMGGLGNQIFQWAASHNFNSNNNLKLLVRYPDAHRREFLLTNLIKNCSHVDTVSKSIFLTRLNQFEFSRIYLFTKLLIGLKQIFGFVDEKNLLSVIKNSNKSSIFCQGYFQDYRYIKNNSDIIFNELLQTIKKVELPKYILELDKYIAVHIRRGDYKPHEQGHLSVDYYKFICNQLPKLPIVIYSDDLGVAQKIGKAIDARYILGPKDASEWELLASFSSSFIAIIANSSLSWWGGFLCEMNSGTVYAPEQWFRNSLNLNGPKLPRQISIKSQWEN